MSGKPSCPMCEMDDLLESPAKWECATCGHEWEREAASEEAASGPRVVKDSNGNILADGDVVMLIKDLPLKGSSQDIEGRHQIQAHPPRGRRPRAHLQDRRNHRVPEGRLREEGVNVPIPRWRGLRSLLGHSPFYCWLLAPMLCGCHGFSTSRARADGDSLGLSASTHFTIVFDKNNTELSLASKETIKAVALASIRYPNRSLYLQGHAADDEADAAVLAQRRATRTAGFMINNYEVDARNISITSSSSLDGTPTVELFLGENPRAKSVRAKQPHKVDDR